MRRQGFTVRPRNRGGLKNGGGGILGLFWGVGGRFGHLSVFLSKMGGESVRALFQKMGGQVGALLGKKWSNSSKMGNIV